VENLVFLALHRSGPSKPVRYGMANGTEIDFVVNGASYESNYQGTIDEGVVASMKKLRGMHARTAVTETVDEIRDGVTLLPLWKLLRDGDLSWKS
jgi:predicted AAA+ superfamily ATPase